MPTPTEYIINKTGRAVVAIGLICFCLGTISWLIIKGAPDNSLHQSALSWSYTVLLIAVAAIGLEASIMKLMPLIASKKEETPTP